ncbi:MAG: helix-turn-helix domain-containing protein, partial [Bacteroidota bacterium]
AAAMEVSNHHLSQLLNEEKQQNFFDFINGYRVREAQERITAGRERTLLEIAYAVGFNNKNSFNSAFKKYLGMTPSAYKKKLNQEKGGNKG